MSGLIMCSEQAQNPLFVEHGTIRICNIEELCYYLYNYTYMITIDFFDENFINFCENEIRQPALAQRVKECLAHKEKLKTIILRVLESSSYYSAEEIKRFEGTLAYLDSSSVLERFKARADMMTKAGKWKSALIIYNEIIDNKEEIMPAQFYARVKSNIGVLYTNLFMYEEASKWFLQAYQEDMTEEYRDYLVCALMMAEDEEGIRDIFEKFDFDTELIGNYKLAFGNAKKLIGAEEKYNAIIERFRYSGRKNLNEYYDRIEETLSEWKEDYRKAMEN